MRKKEQVKTLLCLHIMLMLYSLSGICSKMAAGQPFFSVKFCLYYAVVIILLGAYAIGWQQMIKRLPLTMAFANKSVTVVWGMIWGYMIFHEPVTIGKVLGACLVIGGVVLYAWSDRR